MKSTREKDPVKINLKTDLWPGIGLAKYLARNSTDDWPTVKRGLALTALNTAYAMIGYYGLSDLWNYLTK
ncbi:MAG: hypothetical protein WC796_05955 [Candidatus Pacearchaeota archaeon]|jgi:hypothetical protein